MAHDTGDDHQHTREKKVRMKMCDVGKSFF